MNYTILFMCVLIGAILTRCLPFSSPFRSRRTPFDSSRRNALPLAIYLLFFIHLFSISSESYSLSMNDGADEGIPRNTFIIIILISVAPYLSLSHSRSLCRVAAHVFRSARLFTVKNLRCPSSRGDRMI